MGLTLTSGGGGGGGEKAPAGNHRAICCGVIDLGTQTVDYKNGKPPEDKHKLLIRWELSDEPSQADGRPLQISREFTASLHESSNLRPFLEGWRGKAFSPQELAGFDPSVLIGQPCLLSVVRQMSKKGREFADVASVGKLPRGMAAPEAVADHIHYQIEDGDPPQELPDWIKAKINASHERAALTPTPVAATVAAPSSFDPNDSVPF